MTGLVGTSNDLGMLLLAPTVVALVACMISIGWKRGVYGAVAGLLAITLLAAQSIAAIAAFATALVLLAITAFRRRGLVPLIAGAVLLIGAVFAYAPLRDRVMFVRRAAQQHRYNDLTSLRVPPFLAAWTMFAQHPLLGIGPGGFHSQYLSYRIDVSRRYPQLMPDTASAIENFGETHNDHLQLLAETGAPGYLLLLAFVIFIASASFQRQASEMDDGDPRVRFCRMAALPLAGSFLVLALAQFPMQIAAASIEYLLIAGTLMAWRVSHA
jgi:O-antigen ligase